jgi:tetratricopeptide (TPR) repeat protein
MSETGRNDPCPCGSGVKYKKCCLAKDEAAAAMARPRGAVRLRGGEFIVECRPDLDDAVDRLLQRMERGEGVEDELTDLYEEHPDYSMTNFAMGVRMVMVERNSGAAAEFFRRAAELNPMMAEAHYNLGESCCQSLRIGEAVDAYHTAISLAEEDDVVAKKARDGIRRLERILLKTGPFKTLEAYVENERLFDMAFLHLKKREFTDAIHTFQQVLGGNPDHAQSYGNMALAHAGLGRKASALECLGKALAIDPTYQPAISNRKVLSRMKEGEPHVLAMAETHYSLEIAEAEKKAKPSLWDRLKLGF